MTANWHVFIQITYRGIFKHISHVIYTRICSVLWLPFPSFNDGRYPQVTSMQKLDNDFSSLSSFESFIGASSCLVNNKKRREVFHWLKNKQFSIYMLQEAHCTEKSFEVWAAEWGYAALLSGLVSNKVGVAVLFNNNFSFKILRQLCDKEGRYIIVDLKVRELTLCNIYTPITDDPAFFKTVSEQMLSFKCDEIIIGGDFNLVLDVSKDKTGGKQTTHWHSLRGSNIFRTI